MWELQGCKQNYLIGELINRGGFGSVFAGFQPAFGLHVAVKLVDKRRIAAWEELDGRKVPREIKLLLQVQSVDKVVKLFDFCELRDSYAIVMERPLLSRELFEVLVEQDFLGEKVARDYFEQIVDAAVQCHQCGVFHGDLKLENILVDVVTNRIKLIDFGSGLFLENDLCTTYTGSLN